MIRIFFLISTLLTTSLNAEVDKQLLPIDASGRKVSIPLFHADSTDSFHIVSTQISFGKAVTSYKAAISISDSAQLTLSPQLRAKNSSTILIGKNQTASTSHRAGKRTFLLTGENGKHAIGYAPHLTTQQLTFAMSAYMKKVKTYHTLTLLNTGKSSAFYVKNKSDYQPYYLKEQATVTTILCVK